MSLGSSNPFLPAATVTLVAGTTAANVPSAGGGDAVLITNTTASLAYVRFGTDATVQATAGDTPVLPNSRLLLRCGPLVSYFSALLASGSGSVSFTRGDGSTT